MTIFSPLHCWTQAAKSRDQEGSGSQHFSEVMAGFHAGAAEEFRELEVRS